MVANDGIIATAGILEGFAGAGASDRTLITAATAATIAGMLAVGGAEWAEAAAEREAQLSAVAEEAAEIARQPQVEHAELVAYYKEKGLTPELAHEVADQLMAQTPSMRSWKASTASSRSCRAPRPSGQGSARRSGTCWGRPFR